MGLSTRSVMVIGASGSVGPTIVAALLEKSHNVSVLTRGNSSTAFPDSVAVIQTDYSATSLLKAFKGIDVIISTIATLSTPFQTTIIDSAVAAGVKRFIPSEYGIDDALPHAVDYFPAIKGKVETLKYLKTKESAGISWTVLVVGSFFDWSLQYPGVLGWDVPGRKVTLFDGGDVEYETTNLVQIGKAAAAIVAPENYNSTSNVFVYVNSFTTTQKKVLASLEKATGVTFEVSHAKAKDQTEQGLIEFATGKVEIIGGGEYAAGALSLITGAVYGNGNLNNYSKAPGLWNERLQLPTEDLDETVAHVVRSFN